LSYGRNCRGGGPSSTSVVLADFRLRNLF